MTALGPVRYATIHCSATPEGRVHKAAEITAWDKAQFGMTSYHWVIELDGTRVRTLPDSEKGAHVGKANSGNIGVCYVGGVDAHGKPKDTRTPLQEMSMLTLVRTYKGKYPGIIIRGHRDWPGVAKSCPCFSVRDWLKEVGE